MCFHQNRSLSTRAKGRGHTQQSQGRFHPECAISATAMRCVWPAGPRTISAHAGGTLFPGFQARVPFLPRLTSHGVMPTLQVEGLLREPGRHLSRFANLSFTFLGPLPSAGRPSQHSARSFIPLGLTGAGYARSCAQWRTLACHVSRSCSTWRSALRRVGTRWRRHLVQQSTFLKPGPGRRADGTASAMRGHGRTTRGAQRFCSHMYVAARAAATVDALAATVDALHLLCTPVMRLRPENDVM